MERVKKVFACALLAGLAAGPLGCEEEPVDEATALGNEGPAGVEREMNPRADEDVLVSGADASTRVGLQEAGEVLVSGAFAGRNDHTVEGTASIVTTAGTEYVRLSSDFSLDGAPDPRIGFGSGGEFDESTVFTVLEQMEGTQTYRVPEIVDVARYGELYLWCGEADMVLGVAALTNRPAAPSQP